MSTLSDDHDYSSKVYDLETLQSWAKDGVSDGRLKGFKIRPDESFLPLAHAYSWVRQQGELSYNAELQGCVHIAVFDPRLADYSQTVQLNIDARTASALTQCLNEEIDRRPFAAWLGTASQGLNELTHRATRRLLGGLTGDPPASQKIVLTTNASEVSLTDISFEKLNSLTFTGKTGVSFSPLTVKYNAKWEKKIREQCHDYRDDESDSVPVQKPAESTAKVDLLAPLANDLEIPTEALQPTHQEGDDEFGAFQSNIYGGQVSHES